ncbi:MAG TPA: acyl-CoA dehydrogenase family protein [Gaiellaceae bacterium]|nr:acyl-CoA dehydrogenase family protein [Gaiellaceae bacterium]
MDFALNEIQEELKTQARAWLAERYPLDRDWDGAGSVASGGAGQQDDRWQELAELGWLDVADAGLGFVEEALLLEEMGYALYPGPYLAHVAGGGRIEANGFAYGDAEGELVESVDPTRPLRRSAANGKGETPRLRAAMAAEAVGVAQRVLELGIQHATTREQFGKPIGVYQAVSHQLADTYTDVELARSLAYWAAWCVAEEDDHAPVAAAAAKAFATEAAVAACERSIQVHGGTGFTWEHPLHRFYKRALWLEGFGARPSELRLEVADAVLGITVTA